MKKLTIEDKIGLTKFKVDTGKPHIKIKPEICRECGDKACVTICPVENYKLDEKGDVTFAFEGCYECGSCRIACTKCGLEWDYPLGGYGVCFREG